MVIFVKLEVFSIKINGIVSKNHLVKILGRGDISVSVEVKAHAFSASAQKAIEAVGGSIVKI
jgi:large subunit ribosomal protein L15